MKKVAIIIALAGLVCWATQSSAGETAPAKETASAQEAAPVQAPAPIQEETLAPPVQRQMRISERFGRSMANIFSSPLELPAQMYVRAVYQEDKSTNPFAVAGGLIEGIPMGALVYFPWRLYAGVVDLFTLWAPECDKALIYPEYISFSPDFLDRTKLPLDKNPQAGQKK
jgi:hypothetical protein